MFRKGIDKFLVEAVLCGMASTSFLSLVFTGSHFSSDRFWDEILQLMEILSVYSLGAELQLSRFQYFQQNCFYFTTWSGEDRVAIPQHYMTNLVIRRRRQAVEVVHHSPIRCSYFNLPVQFTIPTMRQKQNDLTLAERILFIIDATPHSQLRCSTHKGIFLMYCTIQWK